MRERLAAIITLVAVAGLLNPCFAVLKFVPDGLTFEEGNYIAQAGDTVTINILDDTNNINSFYLGGIKINNNAEDFIENLSGDLSEDLLSFPGSGYPVSDSSLLTKKVRMMKIGGAILIGDPAISANTPVYTLTFDIKADTPYETIITVDDFNDGSDLPDDPGEDGLQAVTQAEFEGSELQDVVIDPISILVVPEPISLSLLGLGGLLLRRRMK